MRNRLAIAGMLLVSAPALAQNADVRLIASTCVSCHGALGRSPGAMPPLDRRSKEDLAQALREFRSDARPATVMGRIAKGFSDAEIDAVALEIATKWR
ncbi:MAG: sulfide dehydrogenase [Alphaproteobacteria bacterium]|nr:sulfide dehydrogenase [Alphaproteobacteria bacterium]